MDFEWYISQSASLTPPGLMSAAPSAEHSTLKDVRVVAGRSP